MSMHSEDVGCGSGGSNWRQYLDPDMWRQAHNDSGAIDHASLRVRPQSDERVGAPDHHHLGMGNVISMTSVMWIRNGTKGRFRKRAASSSGRIVELAW